MIPQALAPRFGALSLPKNSFDQQYHQPNDPEPYAVADDKHRGFTDAQKHFGTDLNYLDKHYGIDIEIAVKDADGPKRYNVTFIEKDPDNQDKDKRVHAFWSYDSEEPIKVLTQAVSTAHRYYGDKLRKQRDDALAQVKTLREGLAGIQNDARKLLDPKAKDEE